MLANPWQRLDQLGRNLAPLAVSVVLLILGFVPQPLPGYGWIAPQFGLMAVYYWVIHRPDLFRPSMSFTIGLLNDLLSGGTLGLNALVLVLTHWVLLNQRRLFVRSQFVMLWWGFGLVVIAVVLIQWLIVSLMAAAVLPVMPSVFQGLATIALFAPVSWLFIRVQCAFLQAE